MKKWFFVSLLALVLVLGAGAAFLFLGGGSTYSGYFYIQDENLYYASGKDEPLLLSQVKSLDAYLLKNMTMVDNGRIVYPGLNENGQYGLYERGVKDQNSQALVQSVNRVKVLDGGEFLLESGKSPRVTVYLYNSTNLETVAQDVSYWEKCEEVNAIYYISDGILRRLDLDTMETVELADKVDSSSTVESNGDGTVFRYTKMDGTLYVYTGGQETKVIQGTKILAEEALDRFYVCTKEDSTLKMSDFIIDDMGATDAGVKQPVKKDYEYLPWYVEFNVNTFEPRSPGETQYGIYGGFRLRPTKGDINQEFHNGEITAYQYLTAVIESKVGYTEDSSKQFPFSEDDVLRLSRNFHTRYTDSAYDGKWYEGNEYVRTIDGIRYTIHFSAYAGREKILDEERYEADQNAYEVVEKRNEIRGKLHTSIGSTYSLYKFTPEKGLELVADKLYDCARIGDKIIGTASIVPSEKVSISDVTSLDDFRLLKGSEIVNIKLTEEQISSEENGGEEQKLPEELTQLHPDAEAALELLEEGHWVYLVPGEDNALYFYDGAKSTLIDQGVSKGNWAGESSKCIYYIKDKTVYCFDGKKSKQVAENVTHLW